MFQIEGRDEEFVLAHFEILTASEVDDESATDGAFHVTRYFVVEAK